MVDALLDMECAPEPLDSDGFTPFDLAVAGNWTDTVRLMLERNVVNANRMAGRGDHVPLKSAEREGTDNGSLSLRYAEETML